MALETGIGDAGALINRTPLRSGNPITQAVVRADQNAFNRQLREAAALEKKRKEEQDFMDNIKVGSKLKDPILAKKQIERNTEYVKKMREAWKSKDFMAQKQIEADMAAENADLTAYDAAIKKSDDRLKRGFSDKDAENIIKESIRQNKPELIAEWNAKAENINKQINRDDEYLPSTKEVKPLNVNTELFKAVRNRFNVGEGKFYKLVNGVPTWKQKLDEDDAKEIAQELQTTDPAFIANVEKLPLHQKLMMENYEKLKKQNGNLMAQGEEKDWMKLASDEATGKIITDYVKSHSEKITQGTPKSGSGSGEEIVTGYTNTPTGVQPKLKGKDQTLVTDGIAELNIPKGAIWGSTVLQPDGSLYVNMTTQTKTPSGRTITNTTPISLEDDNVMSLYAHDLKKTDFRAFRDTLRQLSKNSIGKKGEKAATGTGIKGAKKTYTPRGK